MILDPVSMRLVQAHCTQKACLVPVEKYRAACQRGSYFHEVGKGPRQLYGPILLCWDFCFCVVTMSAGELDKALRYIVLAAFSFSIPIVSVRL
jgi:hypothetical protein